LIFSFHFFFSNNYPFFLKKKINLEFIEIHYGISLPRLREIILQGEMTLPSVQTTLMALNYLEKNSYLSTPVKLL